MPVRKCIHIAATNKYTSKLCNFSFKLSNRTDCIYYISAQLKFLPIFGKYGLQQSGTCFEIANFFSEFFPDKFCICDVTIS